MAKLFIKTKLNSVVIVGDFCEWDAEKGIRVDRKQRNTLLVVDDMPKGEYRVLSCKSYHGGEVYPSDGRQMANRYFGGEQNETIHCYFN